MEIAFSDSFKKAFKKRIKNNKDLEIIFWEHVKLFCLDPYHSQLKTHKLSGKLKGYFSFTIAYDCRVVFFFTKESPKRAVFTDIGKHDEVY